MSDRRYGFYLRPSLAMSRAQAEIHDLLARQYNLRVAGRFMPHATLKGFFRSDAPVQEMVDRLDSVIFGLTPFTVHNHGVVPMLRKSIVLNIHQDANGAPNAPFQALHEAALKALLPLVRTDCEFTPGEWKGPLFYAHLTLAMADVPVRFFDEILEFVREAEPIGPPAFTADTLQLFAFESDDWGGLWGQSLRWELLHSWRLPEQAASG